MHSAFSNRSYKMNEGPTWNPSSRPGHFQVSPAFWCWSGTTTEVPPSWVRHRGGGPARLAQCINPTCKGTSGELRGWNPTAKAAAKQRPNRISCEAVLIAPFLLGGHARANVGPCLTPLQQVCLLILPPYHIAQVFLFPLEALAVACNPRMVYRVVAPYHMHWLFWRSKQLGFTPEIFRLRLVRISIYESKCQCTLSDITKYLI
jgi:hypothetical protein